MKRGGPLKRNTPLRQYSKKRQATQVQRRTLVAKILAERPYCQAGPRIVYNADRQHYCQTYSTDCHEPLTRARGGDILDPDNILAVCRACHDWIHRNPTQATKLNLLVSRYGSPYTAET